MKPELFDYNTSLSSLKISEYGRIIQEMIEHVCSIEDKAKRTNMADAIVGIMESLNPSVKEQADYKQKLWDHLHIISGFRLDVDGPYPAPVPDEVAKKPEPIPYPTQPIKFRFYGRNLQNMVNKVASMKGDENKETQEEYINLLASFMTNSSRNWNNENLNNATIAEHLKILSQNRMDVNPENLEITIEQRRSTSFKKNNFRNNRNFKFNKRNNNFKNRS